MKKYLVSGIDESYFPLAYKGKKGRAILASVTYDEYDIINIDYDYILVDGNDGTDVFKKLDKGNVVILDGVIFAGFNYIVPEENYIIFYGKKPNIEEIRRALLKHFSTEEDKIRNILRFLTSLKACSTKKGTVYIYTDLPMSLCLDIINKYQVFVKYPEPIRVAHKIATAIMFHVLNNS